MRRLLSSFCRALTVACAGLVVASCGLFGYTQEDASVAYASAEERELLEIPPDLSGSTRQSLLRLPDAGKTKIAHSTLLPDPDAVRLVRDGSVRWLELDVDARELWPELKQFFKQLGYRIARDEPLLGLMETEWRDATGGSSGNVATGFFSGSATGTRERFRVRIERIGEEERPIRLFLTQRRLEPARRGKEMLKRPPEPEREMEMMLQLVIYIGVREQRANGLLSAEDLERLASRAYLEKVDGEPTLVVVEPYHRVWTWTGEALEDIGLDVEGIVKSESRYEVLFTGVPPDKVEEKSDDVVDEESIFYSGRFRDENEIEQYYQIYVLEEPGKTRIVIADATGTSVQPALEEDILKRLQEKLR